MTDKEQLKIVVTEYEEIINFIEIEIEKLRCYKKLSEGVREKIKSLDYNVEKAKKILTNTNQLLKEIEND